MKSNIFVVIELMAFISTLAESPTALDINDLGHTAYGYFENIGIPEAERIYEEENSQLLPRLVGGEAAEIVQYSYQAALLVALQNSTGIGLCGGALIKSNRVLTAAHCWDDGLFRGKYMTVVLGSNKVFSGGTRIETSAVHMHPDWSPYFAINDICVVALPRDVTFTDAIGIIDLPSRSDINNDLVGKSLIVSGYGRIAENIQVQINQSLSSGNVTVISNEECLKTYPNVITASNICTGGGDGSSGIVVSVCKGDSGGPLVLATNETRILMGITSFGSPKGCDAGLPSAYSRVTSYLDFIYAYINGDKCENYCNLCRSICKV